MVRNSRSAGHIGSRSGLAGSTAFGLSFSRNRISAGVIAGAVGALLVCVPQHARALNLYDGGAYGNNVEVNLNLTLSYTGIVRTNNPSRVILSDLNADDGDRNLAHGLVSNEFEITPILDIRDGDYGAHFSGDAYLNTVYLGTNQNSSPSTNNPISIEKNNDYTSATRNVEGENAQLLDAFVYGGEHFGADDSQEIVVKVGRQTLLWGQSLFLSANGIAAGMAPFDVITADNVPNAETQQIIMPVGQVVATYQPNAALTLQGYYQFEWEPDLLEGAGSFFSTGDILDKGGQRLLFGPNSGIPRGKNITPPINNGQFGASVQITLTNYDLGVYALRYDSKAPAVYLSPSFSNYRLVYPRDIWTEGASVSTEVGVANVAGEISFKQHLNLATLANVSATNNANGSPAYPVGDTWAAQVSTIYVSPGIPFDPGGVVFSGEIGFNHVLKVTDNQNAITQPGGINAGPRRSSTAANMEFVITPNYFAALPDLDLSFPVGLEYNLYGRSLVDVTENHGTGNLTLGVTATYKVVWVANLTFDDHVGAVNTQLSGEGTLADRNYVLLNLQRSF